MSKVGPFVNRLAGLPIDQPLWKWDLMTYGPEHLQTGEYTPNLATDRLVLSANGDSSLLRFVPYLSGTDALHVQMQFYLAGLYPLSCT